MNKRAALYIRVSDPSQVERFSLAAQERELAEYCERKGWQVAATFREEGVSAYTDSLAKRPAFKRLLDFAEQGGCDVVVVHKLDRFARNQALAHQVLGRLAKANVGFASKAEDMDYSDASGRLVMSLMLALAEHYSRNLGQEVAKGHRERVAQGLPPAKVPFGVRYGSDGVPEPHPEEYPVLLDIIQWAASGVPCRGIAERLNATGVTNRGKVWQRVSILNLLHNRFFLGEFWYGGRWHNGRHAERFRDFPRELWQQAQEVLKRNHNGVINNGKSNRKWALGGLLRCAACGAPVKISPKDRYHKSAWMYCRGRMEGRGCAQRIAQLRIVEGQVFGIIADAHRRLSEIRDQGLLPQVIDRITSAPAKGRRVDPERVKEAIKRLGERYDWGDITRAEYEARRDELLGMLRDAEPEMRSRDYFNTYAEAFLELTAAFDHLDIPQDLKVELVASYGHAVRDGRAGTTLVSLTGDGPQSELANRLYARIFKEIRVDHEGVVSYEFVPELEALLGARQPPNTSEGSGNGQVSSSYPAQTSYAGNCPHPRRRP